MGLGTGWGTGRWGRRDVQPDPSRAPEHESTTECPAQRQGCRVTKIPHRPLVSCGREVEVKCPAPPRPHGAEVHLWRRGRCMNSMAMATGVTPMVLGTPGTTLSAFLQIPRSGARTRLQPGPRCSPEPQPQPPPRATCREPELWPVRTSNAGNGPPWRRWCPDRG